MVENVQSRTYRADSADAGDAGIRSNDPNRQGGAGASPSSAENVLASINAAKDALSSVNDGVRSSEAQQRQVNRDYAAANATLADLMQQREALDPHSHGYRATADQLGGQIAAAQKQLSALSMQQTAVNERLANLGQHGKDLTSQLDTLAHNDLPAAQAQDRAEANERAQQQERDGQSRRSARDQANAAHEHEIEASREQSRRVQDNAFQRRSDRDDDRGLALPGTEPAKG